MAEQYPEHKKVEKTHLFSQQCREFIDWLRDDKKISLVKFDEEEKLYYYIHISTDTLLAEFFGIDQNKLEAEKQMMLKVMREMNKNPNLCRICNSEKDANGRCRCRGNNIGYVKKKRPEARA